MNEDETENFEEKIECMKRDGVAFYLCESTIEIIKNVSGKSDVVEGINCLINVADENAELKKIIETMQSNIDFERGQKVQANKTIKELLEALK